MNSEHTLLIDVGNTRIKLAKSHRGQLLSKEQHSWRGAGLTTSDLTSLIERICELVEKPEQIALSNVAGPEMLECWQKVCQEQWNLQPYVASTQAEQLGLLNAYEEPQRLGIDRWLAMLAAWHPSRSNICVIDCGSATTIDRVNQHGEHLGGLILPGYRLLTDSLTQQTHALTSRQEISELTLGTNTDDAIDAGCTQLFQAGIEGILTRIEQASEDKIEYIITGGDAEFLIGKMTKTLQHEPDLVLKGLELSIPQP